jgi:hypothetical protein
LAPYRVNFIKDAGACKLESGKYVNNLCLTPFLIPFPNNAIRRMATRVMPPAVSASLHWHGSRLGQVSVTEDVRQDIIFAQTPLFCLCVHVRTNIDLFSLEIILQVGCQNLSRLQKTGILHSKIG